MDRMDAAQAREHIEMVDRILAESQQRLCCGGEYFVVWGIVSAFITLLFQLVDQRAISVAGVMVDSRRAARRRRLFHRSRQIDEARARAQLAAAARVLQRALADAGLGIRRRRRRRFESSRESRPPRSGASPQAIVLLLYRNARKPPRADRAACSSSSRSSPRTSSRRPIAAYVLAAGMLAGYAASV